MNSNFTKLLLVGMAAFLLAFPTSALFGQIPNDSPFPVDVIVEGPGGFARQYDYVSISDSDTWGVQPLSQTVSGELIWVDDDDIAGDGLDSLGCDTSSMADYTGKIALVRRGVCFFSDKIYYAQNAGAIGVIVVNNGGAATGGMAAGDDKGLAVTIPAVFIETADAAQFVPKVDAGETIIATFQVRSFFGDLGPYAYGTPKDQVVPLDKIQVDLLNINDSLPVLNISAKVEIVEPDGNIVTLNASKDTILPASVATIEFDDYLPEKAGAYQMVFTNSLTGDTLARAFEITDYTFQMDNGAICTWPTDCWISTTDEDFVTNFLVYDFGNVYYTGANEGTVTHFSFSLGNPDSLYTGDPLSDVFTLTLFDADPDGDGVVGAETTYDNFTPIGFQSYVLTGEEGPYEVLTMELENPIILPANGIYLLMVQYNGVNSALGIPPWPTYSGTASYAGFEEVVFTDALNMDGFGGNYNLVVRMHMDGFTPVSVKPRPPLDRYKVALMPNPAGDYLNVRLSLDEVADKAEMIITSTSGKVMMRQSVQNVQEGVFTFDTSKLPAGHYYLAVNTPEGFRAEKFVVLK